MSSTDQFDRNLKDAESLLERFRQSAVPNIIGGEVVADENLLDVLDPSTNEVLCKLSRGGASVVDRAAKAAMEAFPVWRDLPTARREKVLVAIAGAIEGRAREIALLEPSGERTEAPLLLDNLELLFEPSLQINPLDLVRRLAHSRRVVAVWPGERRGDRLIYADMSHPEHRDYSQDGVVVLEI